MFKVFSGCNFSEDSNIRRTTGLKRTFIFLVTLLLIGQTFAGLERHCPFWLSSPSSSGGVCGRDLVRLVSDICYPYGFNHEISKRGHGVISVVKRGHDEKHVVKQSADKMTPDTESNLWSVMLSKEGASSFLSKRISGQEFDQGIVCECCHNHCSYRELQQYCLQAPVY